MIMDPICNQRRCVHFLGVLQSDGTEGSERVVCEAFPKGIPLEIAYGTNRHTIPLKEQKNEIIYEQVKSGEEQAYVDKVAKWYGER